MDAAARRRLARFVVASRGLVTRHGLPFTITAAEGIHAARLMTPDPVPLYPVLASVTLRAAAACLLARSIRSL